MDVYELSFILKGMKQIATDLVKTCYFPLYILLTNQIAALVTLDQPP